jgi:hypothetical protein
MFKMRILYVFLICFLVPILSFAVNRNGFWSAESSKKLWLSLDMEAVAISYENQKIYRKILPSLVCDKIILQKSTDLRSVQETHFLCVFSKNWSSQQADELYSLLRRVPKVELSRDISFKTVGPLFVFENSARFEHPQRTRVFFDHPCISVQTDLEVQMCMSFWDQYVFQSAILPTRSMFVRTSNKVLTKLFNLSRWNSRWSDTEIRNPGSLFGIEYLVIQQEYLSEMTLNYLTIKKGTHVWPQLLFSVDLSKFEIGNITEELIQFPPNEVSRKSETNKSVQNLEMESLFNLLVDNIYLGENPDSKLDLSKEYLEIMIYKKLEESKSKRTN